MPILCGFSTLYAIGFSPDDAVGIRLYVSNFSVHGIGADFEIKDPDKDGFSEVISDGSGNLALLSLLLNTVSDRNLLNLMILNTIFIGQN